MRNLGVLVHRWGGASAGLGLWGGHDGRRQCCLLLAPWVPTSHAASQWEKKTENSGLTSPCAASTAFKSAHAKSRSLSEVSRGGGVTERRPPFSQRSAKKNLSPEFRQSQLATSVSSTFSIPTRISGSEVSHGTRCEKRTAIKKKKKIQ